MSTRKSPTFTDIFEHTHQQGTITHSHSAGVHAKGAEPCTFLCDDCEEYVMAEPAGFEPKFHKPICVDCRAARDRDAAEAQDESWRHGAIS